IGAVCAHQSNTDSQCIDVEFVLCMDHAHICPHMFQHPSCFNTVEARSAALPEDVNCTTGVAMNGALVTAVVNGLTHQRDLRLCRSESASRAQRSDDTSHRLRFSRPHVLK